MKRSLIIFLLLCQLFSFQVKADTINKKEINQLYTTLTQSLESNEQLIYKKHIIKSISSGGDLVTFDDNMSITINWWYTSVPKAWKAGDHVYLRHDFEYRLIELKHATLSESIAWGTIKTSPKKICRIKTIHNALSDPEMDTRIDLDDNFSFKCIAGDTFEGWMVKDRVYIFANSDSRYQLWNLDKKAIALSEEFINQNQVERKPIEIRDVLGIEIRLNSQVLQQPEATKAVALSLLNYTAKLNDKERPIGVFLFVGPTGVGKTELAKAITNDIYHDSSRLTRFDMSHFTEPHSLSRLIGSQPGYVNHEEGGQLTNPLLENAQRVVLLDEMEKAHPQVMKVFLPVFDEGLILDTKNHNISCSETIFIMTSNICAKEIAELFHLGYSSEEILAAIEPNLMEALSPELYNRVEVILFRPLAQETMGDLVKLLLSKIKKNILEEKKIQIDFEDSIIAYLEKNGFHPLLGARPLKKLIEKKVIATLAYHIVKEGVVPGEHLTMYYDSATDSIQIKK